MLRCNEFMAKPTTRQVSRGFARGRFLPGMLLFGLLVATLPLRAAVLHVDAKADPGGDGANWSSACADLRVALDRATSGDELHVAAGVYRPGRSGEREASFELKDGVSVFGGYAGLTDPDAPRNPSVYVTWLSGDLGANDLTGGTAHREDNSHHVLQARNVKGVRLDGLHIRGGQAELYPDHKSGAALLAENAELELSNCVFVDNFAFNQGGAVYLVNCDAVLNDCRFEENRTEGFGGALASEDSGCRLQACQFFGNRAVGGGGNAVDAWKSSLSFIDCEMDGADDQTVQLLSCQDIQLSTTR